MLGFCEADGGVSYILLENRSQGSVLVNMMEGWMSSLRPREVRNSSYICSWQIQS